MDPYFFNASHFPPTGTAVNNVIWHNGDHGYDHLGSSGVQHINGDLYHMQSEESHIGEAILQAGDQLIGHYEDGAPGARAAPPPRAGLARRTRVRYTVGIGPGLRPDAPQGAPRRARHGGAGRR